MSLPADSSLRAIYEELESDSPASDKMDDESISASILKHSFSQDSIVSALRGPEILQDEVYVCLLSILEDEFRRSPTLAARFAKSIIVPTRQIDVNENSNFRLYTVHIPVYKVRHRLWVRPGPFRNRSELEVYEHTSKTEYEEPDTWGRYWSSAREWLREHYSGHLARQNELKEYQNRTGIPFRFLDLPAVLRLMVYEFVVGKQIWPCPVGFDRTFPEESLHDYEYPDRDIPDQIFDEDWFNGISTGIYPIPFWKRQRVIEPIPYTDDSPEDSHVGLGPTKEDQESALALLCVNHQVRKEMAAVVWGKSTKRFNELEILDQIIRYLRKYCTQQELPGHVFAPRDTSVLSHISLSLTSSEYFNFVGYDTDWTGYRLIKHRPGNSIDRVGGLRLLKDIHTLRRLNLQFSVLRVHRPPEDLWKMPLWDLWDSYGYHCQKKLVDIIITLGYELLRGIQAVTISGQVKKSNLDKWNPLLRDQVLTKKPRERLDMTADVAKILATPASEIPPICHCSVSCESWMFRYRNDDENGRCRLSEFPCED